jgi:hypothetical protein
MKQGRSLCARGPGRMPAAADLPPPSGIPLPERRSRGRRPDTPRAFRCTPLSLLRPTRPRRLVALRPSKVNRKGSVIPAPNSAISALDGAVAWRTDSIHFRPAAAVGPRDAKADKTEEPARFHRPDDSAADRRGEPPTSSARVPVSDNRAGGIGALAQPVSLGRGRTQLLLGAGRLFLLFLEEVRHVELTDGELRRQ